MKKFIEELKRRNVIKATIAYLVVAWIIIQVVLAVLPTFGTPDWVIQVIIIVIVVGLPVWIVISWIYDVTPQGIEVTAENSEKQIKREITNKRLNVFIIVSLSIAVIVLTLKISNVFSDSNKQYAIAILPFENMNSDEWFSDGISKDIYTYLAAVKSLKVISTKSTKKYKGTDKTNSEIADELGVDFLIDGNVRKDNKQILISAYLIKANGELVWDDRYDESEEDPFKIQQAVSQKIVEELKIKLSPQEEKGLEKYPTDNKEAYDLFSKGRFVMANDSREKEDLEKNIELNKLAIALDSDFAEAYAEIAQSTFLLGFNHGDFAESMDNAMPYIEKALELNPNTPRALAAKGIITSNRGHWPEAQGYFEKAVAASPSDATIHYQYALHLRHHDVIKQMKHLTKAQILDPRSAQIGHQFFANLINTYKIEEAEQYYNKYSFLFTYEGEQIEKESILIAYKNKDWTTAISFYENELKKDPDNPILNRDLGLAYARILNDDSNYIKYAKKSYELDSTNVGNAIVYYFALLGGEKFSGADKLMHTKNFKSLISKPKELNLLFEYYMAKEDYKKVEDLLKDSLMQYRDDNELFYNAKLGNRKVADSLLNILDLDYFYKAIIYELLKEQDSMYNYLGKLEVIQVNRVHNTSSISIFSFLEINRYKEFDPYRKEERYKALLRKYYLPIKQWNE